MSIRVLPILLLLLIGQEAEKSLALQADVEWTGKEWVQLIEEQFLQDSQDFVYEIVRLALPGKDRRESFEVELPLSNRRIRLQLTPSVGLLHSGFTVVNRYGDSQVVADSSRDDLTCFYSTPRGPLRAAFDLCDDAFNGILTDGAEVYSIKPLPLRFWKSGPRPHLVLRTFLGNGTEKTRAKRSGLEPSPNSPVKIETAVFADRDLFRYVSDNFPIDPERQLLRFVLAMVNAVQLLYHDSTLGRRVDFVVKRLEILHSEPAGLQRSHDIDRYLSSFCLWQERENPSADKSTLHWDHALMLTGLDLYVIGKSGKISNQVVGLAPVAGMCLPSSSCTVNEGRHFESVYVVAHEIGHNLGMRHDGPSADNDCDPGSHIMSPTLGSGKTTWSSCSKNYLQIFLQSLQARCLFESNGPQLDHGEGGALPGERFNADVQCSLKYGKGTKRASNQPLEEICRDLQCNRERYTWTSHPALEGTECGHDKWCRRGRCILRGQVDALDTVTDGGWSDWSAYAECASGCLLGNHRPSTGSTGISVATRRCDNPRPEYGGRPCYGSDKRYKTCEAAQCGNVPPVTITEFAEQICRRAKDVDGDLTGSGFQKRTTDPEGACTVWCDLSGGGVKSRGWTFPDGTVCSTKKQSSRPMFCVSGRCEEFSCNPSKDGTTFVATGRNCIKSSEQSIRFKSPENAWTAAGPCHFNCITPGKGLRILKRGNEHNIQLCEPDKACSRKKTLFEYASKVCGKYKERVRKLSGLGIQLSPSLEDPDRPCHVACQDENVFHRFYLVTGEDGWFPFGTDCAREIPGRTAHCVSGKCLVFGKDNVPQLESKFIFPNIRRRRSLDFENKTIVAKVDSTAIEKIIETLNGGMKTSSTHSTDFTIDLQNPIHEKPDWSYSENRE